MNKKFLDDLCHTIEDVSPTMESLRQKFETKNGKELKYKKIFSSCATGASTRLFSISFCLSLIPLE